MPQPPVSSTGTGNNLPAIFAFLQADSKAKACVGLSNVISNFKDFPYLDINRP